MKHEKRSKWSSQATFILAAIGSAVGLGNAWRFPGLAAKHGGGTYLLIYLVALFVVGIPLLMMEVSSTAVLAKVCGELIKRQSLSDGQQHQMHLLFLPIMQLFSHG